MAGHIGGELKLISGLAQEPFSRSHDARVVDQHLDRAIGGKLTLRGFVLPVVFVVYFLANFRQPVGPWGLEPQTSGPGTKGWNLRRYHCNEWFNGHSRANLHNLGRRIYSDCW
jgi:hypothetical protein